MTANNPIIDSITIQDFKNRFYRGFNYIDNWSGASTYNIGDIVFYAENKKFYQCKNNGVTSIPTTISDWKQLTSISNYIADYDLEIAYNSAMNKIIIDYLNDNNLKEAFLLLSAHILYVDIVKLNKLNANYQGFVSSYSVDGVSESYQIPPYMSSNPNTAWYQQSYYGIEYYAMIYPSLISAGYGIVAGGTNTAYD